MAKQIRQHVPLVVPVISEGFRIGCVSLTVFLLLCLTESRVTEQPFKIPYYAALLRLLYDPADGTASSDGPPLGQQLLEDFWKGFQAFLDKLAWRETRLCVSWQPSVFEESFH